MIFAWVLLALFSGYTIILLTGSLSVSTFQVEQWLLQRPITRLDCVFTEWRLLGEVPVSLCLTGVLGIVCLRLGYRRRVLLYLVLLLLLGAGCEVVGKALLSQPISRSLDNGMTALFCPQLHKQPLSVHIAAMVGIWWKLPLPSEHQTYLTHLAASMPVAFDWFANMNSYPSGHAMRWSFLGVLACWLCWRHMKRQGLRTLSMGLALIVAIAGGLLQFYIGAHLITDMIGGDLLGCAIGCVAIRLLTVNTTIRIPDDKSQLDEKIRNSLQPSLSLREP